MIVPFDARCPGPCACVVRWNAVSGHGEDAAPTHEIKQPCGHCGPRTCPRPAPVELPEQRRRPGLLQRIGGAR